MIESFLSEGKQSIGTAGGIKYGVSLTDGCIGWDETEELIGYLAEAIQNSE
jgi:3-deoxy-7-phosphoheptulonate synthase